MWDVIFVCVGWGVVVRQGEEEVVSGSEYLVGGSWRGEGPLTNGDAGLWKRGL